MELDLDTFLVTVYCLVDDLYHEQFGPCKPQRPGAKPEMSDSEVLTLGLLAQWHPRRSERAVLRYAAHQWRSYFPRQLSQGQFNRRLRDLMGVLLRLGPLLHARLAEHLGADTLYQVLDSIPVPLMRRCRGARHRVFAGEAATGYGGSDKDWYYGVKLLASVSPHGTFTGGVSGPANTDDHFLADALFRWRSDLTAPAPTAPELEPWVGLPRRGKGTRQGPRGPLSPSVGAGAPSSFYLADLGFRGRGWHHHWRTAYGAQVLTRQAYGQLARPVRRRCEKELSHLRQQVETAFQCLTDQFGLRFPRAHTLWGLWTRLAAKLAAVNLLVTINYSFHRSTYELFDPFV